MLRIGNANQNQDVLHFTDLGKLIEWTQYSTSSAQFQEKQLQYWQKKTMQQLTSQDFSEWLRQGGFLKLVEEFDEDKLLTLKSEVTLYQDMQDMMQWLFEYESQELSQDQQESVASVDLDFFKAALQLLESGVAFESLVSELSKKTGTKGKQLFIPLRLASDKA